MSDSCPNCGHGFHGDISDPDNMSLCTIFCNCADELREEKRAGRGGVGQLYRVLFVDSSGVTGFSEPHSHGEAVAAAQALESREDVAQVLAIVTTQYVHNHRYNGGRQ